VWVCAHVYVNVVHSLNNIRTHGLENWHYKYAYTFISETWELFLKPKYLLYFKIFKFIIRVGC